MDQRCSQESRNSLRDWASSRPKRKDQWPWGPLLWALPTPLCWGWEWRPDRCSGRRWSTRWCHGPPSGCNTQTYTQGRTGASSKQKQPLCVEPQRREEPRSWPWPSGWQPSAGVSVCGQARLGRHYRRRGWHWPEPQSQPGAEVGLSETFPLILSGGGGSIFLNAGFSGGSDSKASICLQCRTHRFDPWVGKIPWRGEWQPTPVFLPGDSHGQRSLVGLQSMGSQRVGHDRETSTFACSHPSEHTWRGFQSSLAWRAGFASADMGTLIWPCTQVLDLLFWKERHYHTPQKGLNLQKYTIDTCFTFYHYYFVFLSVYFLYSDSLHRCKTHEFRSHAYVGKNIYTYDWQIIISLINV